MSQLPSIVGYARHFFFRSVDCVLNVTIPTSLTGMGGYGIRALLVPSTPEPITIFLEQFFAYSAFVFASALIVLRMSVCPSQFFKLLGLINFPPQRRHLGEELVPMYDCDRCLARQHCILYSQ